MYRARKEFLLSWLSSHSRKPLVIRGARQVGKTWLVKDLAKSQNLVLIEINFERDPQFASLFQSNDPQRILLNLSAALNLTINPHKSLLFLDEIQVKPELLAKLRWFAEELPELPVIAAGSLLEFALSDHSFSMPVGRINYMYLEPLSFEEFLFANGKEKLLSHLTTFDIDHEIPLFIHEQLTTLFKEYLIVGGMPAAVFNWISDKSLQKISQIQSDLIATYRDDFSKYSKKIPTNRLEEVIKAVPMQLGQKFTYSRINPSIQGTVIKEALSLLVKARICHRVQGCAANGIPLGAELSEKKQKVIFVDVGLCSASLGISLDQLIVVHDIMLINSGAIAEQVVGQNLRTIVPAYIEPELYYWHREAKGSSAEVDYVIQHGNKVIPIEVKAGSTGSLKSLHLFMLSKGLNLALRINSDLPSLTPVNVNINSEEKVSYNLLSIPFYMISLIPDLLNKFINR